MLLAVVTIALYSPAITHPFLAFDDSDYVTANAHVQGGLAWSTVKWAFTATDAANWHPLTWLSHAFDYELFGLNASGHHLDSVLIHAVNAVLLFLLLAQITKRVGPSLLVAALFAVHPLNVESVAWVAERKSVLSTLFFLLAIAAYAHYARKPNWRRYLLVAALFAAGLMAKPMVITLPFVLLLLDYWPLDRLLPGRSPLDGNDSNPSNANGLERVGFAKLLLEKVPLLFLSAASAYATLVAQRSGQAVRTLQQSPVGVRVENAVVSYGLYLEKMLWPTRLAVLYPFPENMLPLWQVALSTVTLLGITTFVIAFRRKRYLLIGWLWFLGTLVPVIGLIRVGAAAMADRYAYIALIGIFVTIAWGLDDWADARAVENIWRAIPVVCVLAVLGFVTFRQLGYWDNDYDLWTHALAVNEQNPFAHDALAISLVGSGETAGLNQQGEPDSKQKRMQEARVHFERAVELRRQLIRQNPAYLPDMATTLTNLANLDLVEGRTAEGSQHYEEALNIFRQLEQQDPDMYESLVVNTLMNLGFLERDQKQPDKSYAHFQEALQIDRRLAQQDPNKYLPDEASKLLNLGNFETEQNRMDAARPHYEEAVRIYRQLAQQNPETYLPELAGTLSNLGLINQLQKRSEETRDDYTEAITIFRQLSHGNSGRYSAEITKLETGLAELGKQGRPN